MIERFTVDVVADEIDRQVRGAQPDSKMVRRFFRRGRREGRRLLEPDRMRSFVIEAVGLATSKIGQDHLGQAESTRRQLQGMQAKTVQLIASIDRASSELAAAPDPDALAPSAVGPGKAIGDTSALQGPVQALVARRAAAERGRLRNARDAEQVALDELRGQVQVAEANLAALPEQFRQLIASTHRAGRLLWARYCMGYEVGKSRRGVPDSALEGPAGEDISFDYPEALELSMLASQVPPAASFGNGHSRHEHEPVEGA